MPTTLGIDVGVGKGLDLVLVDGDRRVLDARRHATCDDVTVALGTFEPDVVAIDSPPAWGRSGGLRAAERELLRLGIHSYGTPSDPVKRSSRFYDWMREGFRVFRAAHRAGYRLYAGGEAGKTAMEVFPHATSVALADRLPPIHLTRTARASWRGDVLRANGVRPDRLHGADQIDAALAALTGLLALEGRCRAVGDPDEGVVVVPLDGARDRPFTRVPAAAGRSRPRS